MGGKGPWPPRAIARVRAAAPARLLWLWKKQLYGRHDFSGVFGLVPSSSPGDWIFFLVLRRSFFLSEIKEEWCTCWFSGKWIILLLMFRNWIVLEWIVPWGDWIHDSSYLIATVCLTTMVTVAFYSRGQAADVLRWRPNFSPCGRSRSGRFSLTPQFFLSDSIDLIDSVPNGLHCLICAAHWPRGRDELFFFYLDWQKAEERFFYCKEERYLTGY